MFPEHSKNMVTMSKNEKLAKLRNQEFDTKKLIGAIDEDELKKIAAPEMCLQSRVIDLKF